MCDVERNSLLLKSKISKTLRDKANEFLNNRNKANNLLEIIQLLEKGLKEKRGLIQYILSLEVVFIELLRRREFLVDSEGNATSEAEVIYRHWLKERYEETWSFLLKLIDYEKPRESSQALVSCMNLLAEEGKNNCNTAENSRFPQKRLRNVLEKLVSAQRIQSVTIENFKKYTNYLDVVQNSWQIMTIILKKSTFKNEISALNYLELLQILPFTNDVQTQDFLLCTSVEKTSDAEILNCVNIRKCINKVWNNLSSWLDADTPKSVHKQLLILLLERIIPHLEKPVLLTDFLMDSLGCGGAISLLALQGVFTLIQKHNITYPNIYEKLYSMFEPEIFHTKFKARLFHLADIFLSSTHLPENLVAAFIKRLARLSLISPPQDAIIILYFIGNLFLRHSGLRSLICAQHRREVAEDPFIMEEREPTKSNAVESSLWEIVALQKHSIPSVATAAKFISQPLPNHEWDLSSVLELKEDDIFDQEINKRFKSCAVAFERPESIFLPKNDKFQKHWSLL